MKLLPQSKHEYEFQMVSFVDVIFVLLSFFVLGSSFKMPEKDFGLGYSQPAFSSGAKAGDFPTNVLVELRRSGAGAAIQIGRAKLPDNDFGAIRAKLSEINMPQMNVLLAAEGDLSVDVLARAMDAALASPMKKVSITTLERSAAPPVAMAAAGN